MCIDISEFKLKLDRCKHVLLHLMDFIMAKTILKRWINQGVKIKNKTDAKLIQNCTVV